MVGAWRFELQTLAPYASERRAAQLALYPRLLGSIEAAMHAVERDSELKRFIGGNWCRKVWGKRESRQPGSWESDSGS